MATSVDVDAGACRPAVVPNDVIDPARASHTGPAAAMGAGIAGMSTVMTTATAVLNFRFRIANDRVDEIDGELLELVDVGKTVADHAATFGATSCASSHAHNRRRTMSPIAGREALNALTNATCDSPAAYRARISRT